LSLPCAGWPGTILRTRKPANRSRVEPVCLDSPALKVERFERLGIMEPSLLSLSVPTTLRHFLAASRPGTGLHLCAQIVMLTCFTYSPEITPYPALIAGGTHMAEYRAYLIGDDGHFYDVFHLTCADDAEAIEMAKKLVIDRDVELWQLDRKIGTFSLKQK